jgi:hypothetical protein
MPRPIKPRACEHLDRKIYAQGLCKSCYDTLNRDKVVRAKVDKAYEDRNRTKRNEQRRLLAAKRYKKAKSN